jgi:hypothetical protein
MNFIVCVNAYDDDGIEIYCVRFRGNDENTKQLILEHVSYCYDRFGLDIKVISKRANALHIFAETDSESEISLEDEEEL